MSENVKFFEYHGKRFRTIEIDGKLWFFAKDICDNQGFNIAWFLTGIDKSEKTWTTIQTPDKTQTLIIVSATGYLGYLLRLPNDRYRYEKECGLQILGKARQIDNVLGKARQIDNAKQKEIIGNTKFFEYDGKKFRVVESDGKLWFVVQDIFACLHIDTAGALSHVGDSEKRTAKVKTANRTYSMSVISETGLYDLLTWLSYGFTWKGFRWARQLRKLVFNESDITEQSDSPTEQSDSPTEQNDKEREIKQNEL